MRRLPLFVLAFSLFAAPFALAHQPADVYSARADVRVDDQRGLRVRVWFEVPDARVGDVSALRDRLAACLPLSLGGELLAGQWLRGGDPKDGLSNGSHTLMALEFEPAVKVTEKVAEKRFELTLRIECFGDQRLSLAGNVRAREPWNVVEEDLPAAAGHHGHRSESGAGDGDGMPRTLRVVFERSE